MPFELRWRRLLVQMIKILVAMYEIAFNLMIVVQCAHPHDCCHVPPCAHPNDCCHVPPCAHPHDGCLVLDCVHPHAWCHVPHGAHSQVCCHHRARKSARLAPCWHGRHLADVKLLAAREAKEKEWSALEHQDTLSVTNALARPILMPRRQNGRRIAESTSEEASM
eukprot:4859173-Amphidinium_carterae.2